MFKKDIYVTSNIIDGFSTVRPNIVLYQGDMGIEFDIIIILDDSRKSYLLKSIDKDCEAKVKIINNENRDENIIKNIEIIDDKICFIITEEIQKYISKIGKYTLQFTIYNDFDFSFTIAPFEIEIKKKMGFNNILKGGN